MAKGAFDSAVPMKVLGVLAIQLIIQ